MATKATTPQTKVTNTLEVKGMTSAKLEKELGKPLGSPINSIEEGAEVEVELTGKIEIREYNNVKGAYFTTKQGISIKVNASFDADLHKAGSKHTIVCRVFENTEGAKLKFASFKSL